MEMFSCEKLQLKKRREGSNNNYLILYYKDKGVGDCYVVLGYVYNICTQIHTFHIVVWIRLWGDSEFIHKIQICLWKQNKTKIFSFPSNRIHVHCSKGNVFVTLITDTK